MFRRIAGFALSAALLANVGCASAPIHPVRLPPAVESQTLGDDDVFDVTVYEDPTLSHTFRISPDGSIDFPLIGRLVVDGKEPQEVADLIAAKLREKEILRAPSVSVQVKEINSKKISVFGQVTRPGQYPLTPGETVVELLTVAGGFTPIADRDRVTLNRKVSKDKVVRVVFSVAAMTEGKIGDVPLQAGDSIYVDERVF